MNLKRIKSICWMAVVALGLCGAAAAQEPDEVLAAEFPAKSITTVERAKAALNRVPGVRAEIGRRTQRERDECYRRFFTTACLNEAQDRERKSNKIVRRVQVEANALLRKEKAAERDRAVAEREQRAAEQRARAITITGAARDGEPAEADADSTPATAPAADDSRR